MARASKTVVVKAVLLVCSLVAAVGCASPGVPQAPSLNLPELAEQVTGERVGDSIHLRWTVSGNTTDGRAVRGPMNVVVCLEISLHGGCSAIDRRPAVRGSMEQDLSLDKASASGPLRAIVYRVEIQNGRGRSAGLSAAAVVPGGAGVGEVSRLRVSSSAEGLEICWDLQANGDPVELRRTAQGTGETSSVVLRAGGHDEGGLIDPSAVRQTSYGYTAQRTRRVTIEGQQYEVRGPSSGPVLATYVDSFAPSAPTALVAVPGSKSINLSWKAGRESDLAGYFVYRREGAGPEVRLTTKLDPSPDFRDLSARPGVVYSYRVTALDVTGNESSSSEAVKESLSR